MIKMVIKPFMVLTLVQCLAHKGYAEDDLLKILGQPAASTSEGASPFVTAERFLSKELPVLSSEQDAFFAAFAKQDYPSAISLWDSAFSATEFANTSSAKALYAFILYKNSLPNLALENLFAIEAPKTINKDLLDQWRESVPGDAPVWTSARLTWNAEWTEIFGTTPEVSVQTRTVSDTMPLAEIEAILKKTTPHTPQRGWVQWQYALALSQTEGQVPKAAQVLKSLLDVKNSGIGSDLIHLTAARLLFQFGYLDAALSYYKKIPRLSEYWFDASEEKAWTYLRKQEPQNALGETRALAIKELTPLVGPEYIFVDALAHLKVCHFTEVAQDLVEFKTRFKQRALKLGELTKTPEPASIIAFISAPPEKLEKKSKSKAKVKSQGFEISELPRRIMHDEKLSLQIKAYHEYQSELKHVQELNSANKNASKQLVELQSKYQADTEKQKLDLVATVKELAEADLNEIKTILGKMHVVEAELLQRSKSAKKIASDKTKNPTSNPGVSAKLVSDIKRGSTASDARETISFPFEPKETWFDEVAFYNFNVEQSCVR